MVAGDFDGTSFPRRCCFEVIADRTHCSARDCGLPPARTSFVRYTRCTPRVYFFFPFLIRLRRIKSARGRSTDAAPSLETRGPSQLLRRKDQTISVGRVLRNVSIEPPAPMPSDTPFDKYCMPSTWPDRTRCERSTSPEEKNKTHKNPLKTFV